MARLGAAGRGGVWNGWIGLARRGTARRGTERTGRARQGVEWLAGNGQAGIGLDWNGREGRGEAGIGMAEAAGNGLARTGAAWRGGARHGVEWTGWTGKAWRGKEWLERITERNNSMADKVRENRLRRKADRMGLLLSKSRRRDPDALDYGLYALIMPETGDTIHQPPAKFPHSPWTK